MVVNKTVLIALVFAAALASCAKPEDVRPQDARPATEDMGLEDIVSALADEADLSGVVLVASGGDIVLEQAYNPAALQAAAPVGTDSRFAIASMTKSFTAVLALRLVEAGKLSLDDTLKARLPEYAADYADRVTVRHLLQNRSGIPHYIDLPGWFDNDVKRSLTPDALLRAIAALPLKFEPGTKYLYSNANYYLLGLIIEKTAGASYEAVLRAHILEPLALNDTGQIYEAAAATTLAPAFRREENGAYRPVSIVNPQLFRATGSQFSTARDLHAWSRAVERGDLLSADSKAVMLTPGASMAWTVSRLALHDGAPVQFYGYNGELNGYTSMIKVFPEHDGVVIILNNNNAGYNALLAMTRAIASTLYGPSSTDGEL